MEEIIKHYTNGEVTIVWKPNLCTHAAFCWKELPEVFDPKKRPWVNAEGASTERIIKQIKRCPSGALAYFMNADGPKEDKKEKTTQMKKIEIIPNGPLLINEDITVTYNGKDINKSEGAAFCRCGKSKNQPFCDGSHLNNEFE